MTASSCPPWLCPDSAGVHPGALDGAALLGAVVSRGARPGRGPALESAPPTREAREGHRLYQAVRRGPKRQQDHKDAIHRL